MNELNHLYKYEHLYDKYDIIDFLEPDYIDYLNMIPQKIWTRYKKDIEIKLLETNNKIIIEFVMNKISLDYVNMVIKNLPKINFELFKIITTNPQHLDKIKKKLIKNEFLRNELYRECILNRDLDFNIYFYNNIYTILNPSNNVKKQIEYSNNDIFKKLFNIVNNIQINKTGYNNQQAQPAQPAQSIQATQSTQSAQPAQPDQIVVSNSNEFKIIIEKLIKNRYQVPKYFNVIKYYIDKFNLHSLISNLHIDTKTHLYKIIYDTCNFNSFDNLIELQKFLQINNNNFINFILFRNSDANAKYNPVIILNICKSGDIDYFIKVMNYFKPKDGLFTDHTVISIIAHVMLTKNVDVIIVIINYLKYNKNVIFTKELYSSILEYFVSYVGSNHHEYTDIIFELINLGGTIKGFTQYTDYIKSIKYLNNN